MSVEYAKPRLLEKPVKLLPCPFCGGKVHIFPLEMTEGLRVMHKFAYPYYRAVCQGGCGCIMGDFEVREDAVAAWNRRAN